MNRNYLKTLTNEELEAYAMGLKYDLDHGRYVGKLSVYRNKMRKIVKEWERRNA